MSRGARALTSLAGARAFLVDGSGRDLFRASHRLAALECALLDVLVLPLSLGSLFDAAWRHRPLLLTDSTCPLWTCGGGSTWRARSSRPAACAPRRSGAPDCSSKPGSVERRTACRSAPFVERTCSSLIFLPRRRAAKRRATGRVQRRRGDRPRDAASQTGRASAARADRSRSRRA